MSCEHLDRCVPKHICPQGVAGCWPSALMVNARPCALVTHRALERICSGTANRTPSRSQNARILTRISLQTKLRPHWCSGVCVTVRMQPCARWHGCCERSQGKHLPHRTVAPPEQCGRRRRRCSCKSPAGNGFDVQEVCVQGVCLLSKQMSLYKVVSRVCVFKLLCSVRSFFFCDFARGLEENVHSGLWRGWRARVVLHLMGHGVRIELD